jgi:hypothetical protein
MKWLEVIRLGSAGKGSAPLDELLMLMSKVAQCGLAGSKTYRHAALDTELSVHLH